MADDTESDDFFGDLLDSDDETDAVREAIQWLDADPSGPPPDLAFLESFDIIFIALYASGGHR